MTRKTPEPAPFDSNKGAERRARIEQRIDYLGNRCSGWVAQAEASALRWALDLLADQHAQISQLNARLAELMRAQSHDATTPK